MNQTDGRCILVAAGIVEEKEIPSLEANVNRVMIFHFNHAHTSRLAQDGANKMVGNGLCSSIIHMITETTI